MSLKFSIEEAESLGNEIWLAHIPPHQVRFLGPSTISVGPRSIIVVKAARYEPKSRLLSFGADQAVALSVGTHDRAVVIGSGSFDEKPASKTNAQPLEALSHGPGDQLFISMLKKLLPPDMQEAGKLLLDGVRTRYPGDLKKGQKNNFADTPDNFWYVIVQPQVRQLQITVRGDVNHFRSVSKLQILDDRGNTRFKIRSRDDVAEALKLIFHAKRKN